MNATATRLKMAALIHGRPESEILDTYLAAVAPAQSGNRLAANMIGSLGARERGVIATEARKAMADRRRPTLDAKTPEALVAQYQADAATDTEADKALELEKIILSHYMEARFPKALEVADEWLETLTDAELDAYGDRDEWTVRFTAAVLDLRA